MATVQRRTLLVNSGKRKRPRKNKRRKLTRAQIAAGFGGKRRQAALKAHRPKRKNAYRPNRKRPKSRPRSKPRKQKRRKNVSEIITASLAGLNPARRNRKAKSNKKRKKNMAKTRSKRAGRSHAKKQHHKRPARRNAYRPKRKQHRSHGHRPNPSYNVMSVLTDAAWVGGGAIGSRTLTDLILGSSNNVGAVGYGVNFVTGAVAAWGVHSLFRNKRAAADIMIGTVLGMLLRAVQDFTPLGKFAQLSGMGDFMTTAFYMPRVFRDPRSGAISDPNPAATAAIAAAATGTGKGVGSFYSRNMYRR